MHPRRRCRFRWGVVSLPHSVEPDVGERFRVGVANLGADGEHGRLSA